MRFVHSRGTSLMQLELNLENAEKGGRGFQVVQDHDQGYQVTNQPSRKTSDVENWPERIFHVMHVHVDHWKRATIRYQKGKSDFRN